MAVFCAAFGIGAGYCSWRMSWEQQQLQAIHEAPLIYPEDAQRFAKEHPNEYVRLEGRLRTPDVISPEHSGGRAVALETHATPKVARAHVNGYGNLFVHDDWLGTQVRRQMPQRGLFVASSAAESGVRLEGCEGLPLLHLSLIHI
eukprot:TRINITY_DN15099_c0_g1_i1.p2 TRINITY_DN15099_c0_g1~~TRINITY_DN15099_c0_g1_i1.p2  ORF type:complete len:145 (-),score=35.80 TRINITY_DN15099_c0_g1_i1:72-506(-)